MDSAHESEDDDGDDCLCTSTYCAWNALFPRAFASNACALLSLTSAILR
jgi:hypothetical protein